MATLTVVQTLNSKTETSIIVDWTSNSTINYVWYSTDGGLNWTGFDVTAGTNGSYTISGLNPGISYSVKTRVKRRDDGQVAQSSSLSVATHEYPHCSSAPDFTIGSKLTLGIYNPLGRSVTVGLFGANGSQIGAYTVTGTSVSGFDNATMVERLYASIPNAKSGTYRVRVTYGSNVSNIEGGIYSVNASVCSPSIGTVTYRDVNETTVAMTGDNQKIIRNQSSVRFDVTGLVGNMSATISQCRVYAMSSAGALMTISGSTATRVHGTINSAKDITATVMVTDSRGLTASKDITLQMVDWTEPKATISLERESNYKSESTLTVNAVYSSVLGQNSVTLQARYKKTTDTNYSAWETIGQTTTLTLDNAYAWDVQVMVTDIFSSTTYTETLQRGGTPLIFFDRLRSSVGINCFPQGTNTLEVGGSPVTTFNIATAYLTNQIILDGSKTSGYYRVPMDAAVFSGNGFSLSANNFLQVGTGISKVLVSGQIYVYVSALSFVRGIRIHTASGTLAHSYATYTQDTEASFSFAPRLVPVNAGDEIYFRFRVYSSDEIRIYDDATKGTYLTIQAIE